MIWVGGCGRGVVTVIRIISVTGRQVSDLYCLCAGAGERCLLACLFLLLAVLTAQLRGSRGGASFLIGILLLRAILLLGRVVVGTILLLGIGAPHADFVAISVERLEVAREVLATLFG